MFLNKKLFFILSALLISSPLIRGNALLGIGARKAQNQMISQTRAAYNEAQYSKVEEIGKEFLLKYPSASKKRLKEVYLLLGNSYKEQGQYDKALLTYNEAAEFLPKDEDINIALGDVYLIGGLTDNAKDIYRSVLKINKANKSALLGMAKAYYEEGLFSRAASFFKNYEDISGEDGVGPYFLYYYAMAQYLSNNQEEALSLALRALSYEDTADNLFLLAKIYRSSDDRETALVYIDAALDKDPSRDDIYLTKALWLSFEPSGARQAESMADSVLKRDGRDKLALFVKYLSMKKQGKSAAAARAYLLKIMDLEGDQFIDKLAAKLYYSDKAAPR